MSCGGGEDLFLDLLEVLSLLSLGFLSFFGSSALDLEELELDFFSLGGTGEGAVRCLVSTGVEEVEATPGAPGEKPVKDFDPESEEELDASESKRALTLESPISFPLPVPPSIGSNARSKF